MNARKVAAQFAAYTWLENVTKGGVPHQSLRRFARKNWQAFLPAAPEGLGRLLIRVGSKRPGGRVKQRRRLGRQTGVALA